MTRARESFSNRRLSVSGGRARSILWIFGMVLFLLPAPVHGTKLKAGDPLPSFQGGDLEGNPVVMDSLRGKALLLDFWSINCLSCLEEMPHLVGLYNKYRELGFEVVGINMDRSEKRVRKFLENSLPYKMTYRNVVDKRAEIMRLLSVQMLPTTILVDPAGTIRLFHVGYKPGFEAELEEEIRKLLPGD